MVTVTVRRFRKKPVEIEAWQWDSDEYDPALRGWIGNVLDDNSNMLCGFQLLDDDDEAEVYNYLHKTWVKLKSGDWIIKGIQGEFYPCKPDIFEATYDEADKPDLLGRLADEMLDHFEFEKYEQLGLQCQYCLWVPGREWDPIHDCVLKHLYDETKSKEVSE